MYSPPLSLESGQEESLVLESLAGHRNEVLAGALRKGLGRMLRGPGRWVGCLWVTQKVTSPRMKRPWRIRLMMRGRRKDGWSRARESWHKAWVSALLQRGARVARLRT